MIKLVLIPILCLTRHSLATPAFNVVNGVDVNGQKCPLPTLNRLACPLICVTDISNCPEGTKPSCGKGLTYCQDGTCKKTCAGVTSSPCYCKQDLTLLSDNVKEMYPCGDYIASRVQNFNASDSSITKNACLNALGISEIDDWSLGSEASSIFLDCPTVAPPTVTLKEPMFLAFWTTLALQFVTFISWFFYKRSAESAMKERGVARNNSDSSLVSDEKAYLSKLEKDGLYNHEKDDFDNQFNRHRASSAQFSSTGVDLGYFKIKSYKSSTLGKIGLYNIYLTMALCSSFLFTLCLDYYGLLNGVGAGLFYANYDCLGQYFIVVWSFLLVWVIVLLVFRERILNFFRINTTLKEGDYVQVEQKKDPTVLQKIRYSFLVRLVLKWEKWYKHRFGKDMVVQTYKIMKGTNGTSYFMYNNVRYVYNEQEATYLPITYNLGETNRQLLQHVGGLTSEEATRRLERIGPNFVPVRVPSYPRALFNEVMGFFYIYQFMMLWLFYYYAYWQIGIVNTVVILVSILIKVITGVKATKRLSDLAEHRDICHVIRDGVVTEISTTDLVVGDMLVLEGDKFSPCDCVLVSGDVVVDECSLTGEAMPVRKFPVKDDENLYEKLSSGRLSTLLAGTRVLQSNPTNKSHAYGLVTATGITTEKGQMIQKILYPTEILFIFNIEMRVVLAILGTQGVIWFCLALYLLKYSPVGSWFFATYALIEIISPILPAALVIGQSVAVQRLKQKGVHCVDVPRVMLAGKIQIFCFDKTGTLTKEGLDFYGLVQTEYGRDSNLENMLSLGNPNTVKELTDSSTDNVKDFGALTELALGTCHSVTELDGKLIGNPVDVEMFTNTHRTIKLNESDSSKAIVSPPQDVKSNANFITDHAEVVKQFEFIHHRQSMSVVVRYPNSANSRLLHVFAKGSFEKILEKCNPGSIPANYHSIAECYAKQGCYVLAIAHKVVDEVQATKRAANLKLDTDGAENSDEWNRDEIESDLNLVCLILFKNLLKEDTGAAIDEIKKSNTRVVMITGDATLTGINIARKSGMINYGRRVILGDVSESEAQNRPNESPNGIQNTDTVAWTDVDTEQSVDIHELEQSGSEPYDLALTSRAFNRLHNAGKLDKSILMNTRIFGRMTPKDKVDCIKLHMKYGITAMCGDGGNDCGALRVAHVGLAMSNSEASIVSPFSTAKKSVFSCVELLSQGRGALATSFANYKFLMLYGQTMAMFKFFSMYFSSLLSLPVWITIDGLITVGMSLSISLSKPVEKLANIRPTARLFGPTTMLSTVGQVLINWTFMIVCLIILYRQPWYRCHELDASTIDLKMWWLLGDNYEAMTVGITIMFQFVNSGFIYNFGYKFRRFWFRNYVLVIIYLAFISVLTVVVLLPPNVIGCLYRMNCGDKDVLQELGYKPPGMYIEPYNIPQGHNVYPPKFRLFMWIYCLANVCVGILWEVLVVIGPIGAYFSKRHGKKNYYQ